MEKFVSKEAKFPLAVGHLRIEVSGTFYHTVSGIIADALEWMNFFLFIPCLIILLAVKEYLGESVVAIPE